MAGIERLESDAIRDLASRLTETFGQTHSADQVSAAIETLYRRFDDSKVRNYIPLLVEHGAREQLQASRK